MSTPAGRQAAAMPTGADHTDPPIRVNTLGTFRVAIDGRAVDDSEWRRRSARQLLKALLSRAGRRMSRDEVVELFWPESKADAAATNLRSTLHALRRALESGSHHELPAIVYGDQASLWLASESTVWSDADHFEHLVTAAWRAADPLPLFEQASALYTGDYLPDDLYEDWATDRREALRHAWTELQFGLAQAFEARSDLNAALLPLERLLRADPCDERAAQELIRLLTRFGRRAEALRVFERLSRSLRDELDVSPSRDTLELHRQIGGGESITRPPAVAAASAFH